MSSNTLKKMIIFSSEEKKLFVEKMIADECLIKDKSASKCIEEHLLNSLLSEDKDIRDLVCDIYLKDREIKVLIQNVFIYLSNSLKLDGKICNTAGKLLRFIGETTDINYESQLSIYSHEKINLIEDMDNCKVYMNEIINMIKKEYIDTNDEKSKKFIKNIDSMLDNINSPLAEIYLSSITRFLYEFWDYCKKYHMTYKFINKLFIKYGNLIFQKECEDKKIKERYGVVSILSDFKLNDM